MVGSAFVERLENSDNLEDDAPDRDVTNLPFEGIYHEEDAFQRWALALQTQSGQVPNCRLSTLAQIAGRQSRMRQASPPPQVNKPLLYPPHLYPS
jgi:hypothetical protein